MDSKKLPSDLTYIKEYRDCSHLTNYKISSISLQNQDGNQLKLNRLDTFRIVLYCFPMTGRPDKPLPPNWSSIPGANGCTSQTCSFRNNYEKFIASNSIPIGVSTQSVEDLKEMVKRLQVPYDVLSDENLDFANLLDLPRFSINDKIFIKRLTLIIEKSIVKKVFYPIFQPDKHVNEVLEWLKKN